MTAFIVAGEPRSGDAVTDPLRRWLIIGVMVGGALLLTAYAKKSRMSSAPSCWAWRPGSSTGCRTR